MQTGRVVVCRSRVFGIAVGVLMYDGRKTAAEAAEEVAICITIDEFCSKIMNVLVNMIIFQESAKPKAAGAKLSMAALMAKKPKGAFW